VWSKVVFYVCVEVKNVFNFVTAFGLDACCKRVWWNLGKLWA